MAVAYYGARCLVFLAILVAITAATGDEGPSAGDLASAIYGNNKGAVCNNLGLLGTSKLPAHSCREIAEQRSDVSNGIYYIKSIVTGDSFPVYCDMAHGGYTMVYKGVSGVKSNVYHLWNNNGVANEDKLEALNTNNLFKAQYKNRLVDEWRKYRPKEVVVVLYSGGGEVLRLVFDGHLSSKNDWFSKERVAFSPYTDLKTSTTNYFSIVGHLAADWGRHFFINKNYGGCHVDAGWLIFYSRGAGCSWDQRSEYKIKYSRSTHVENWSAGNVGEADVLAVFVD